MFGTCDDHATKIVRETGSKHAAGLTALREVSAVTAAPFVPKRSEPSAATHCTRDISGLDVYQEKIAPPSPSAMNGGKLPNCSEPVAKTRTFVDTHCAAPVAENFCACSVFAPVKVV